MKVKTVTDKAKITLQFVFEFLPCIFHEQFQLHFFFSYFYYFIDKLKI